MAEEETQGQTPEEQAPADAAPPKPSSRPPAVPVNKSFRFAVQRNEKRLDATSDVDNIAKKIESDE